MRNFAQRNTRQQGDLLHRGPPVFPQQDRQDEWVGVYIQITDDHIV